MRPLPRLRYYFVLVPEAPLPHFPAPQSAVLFELGVADTCVGLEILRHDQDTLDNAASPSPAYDCCMSISKGYPVALPYMQSWFAGPA